MSESLENITEVTPDAFDLAFDAALGMSEDLPEDDVAAPEADVTPEPAPVVPEPEVAPEPVIVPEVKTVPVVDPVAEAAKAKADEDARAEAERAAEAAKSRELPTAEEQAVLAQVQSDFPEVAKAFDIYKRTIFAQAENFVTTKLAEVQAQLNQQMAPALHVSQQYAKNAHEAEILKGHSDAFAILPKVEAWIDSQPGILKSAYNAVLDNGSAPQIVELFTLFKDSTKAPAAAAPSQEDVQQKAAKEKKLNAQEGVRGRHTSGRATVDPDDFDGAFEKFAATA